MRLKSIGKIVSNKKVAGDCYCMRLRLQPGFKKITPGQFIHIRLNNLPAAHTGEPRLRWDGQAGTDEILLRRPFSIYNVIDRKESCVKYGPTESVHRVIEILYQIVGKGTSFMKTLRPGVKLDILGPLGQGFKINSQVQLSILVGGGIGVAGLHLLFKQLQAKKSRPLSASPDVNIGGQAGSGTTNIYTLIGAKTRKQLYLVDAYKKSSPYRLIATEDGSRGFKGLVTLLLKRLLSTPRITHNSHPRTQIYACGPDEMIKEVCHIAQDENISTQVSLESQMGCGLGICRGCARLIRDGKTVRSATVCADGPVFEAGQLIYD